MLKRQGANNTGDRKDSRSGCSTQSSVDFISRPEVQSHRLLRFSEPCCIRPLLGLRNVRFCAEQRCGCKLLRRSVALLRLRGGDSRAKWGGVLPLRAMTVARRRCLGAIRRGGLASFVKPHISVGVLGPKVRAVGAEREELLVRLSG